jgi:hypothetical protein
MRFEQGEHSQQIIFDATRAIGTSVRDILGLLVERERENPPAASTGRLTSQKAPLASPTRPARRPLPLCANLPCPSSYFDHL